jgi:hypothetical protein
MLPRPDLVQAAFSARVGSREIQAQPGMEFEDGLEQFTVHQDDFEGSGGSFAL